MVASIDTKKPLAIFKLINTIKNQYDIIDLDNKNLVVGQDVEKCFIIKQGEVTVIGNTGRSTLIGPGDPIGFCEASSSRPYSLKYIIDEPIQVYSFTPSDVRQKVNSSSALMKGIIKYSLDRVFGSTKSKTYLFIDDGFLSKQNPPFPFLHFKDGDLIFQKGMAPTYFYFVTSGSVEILDEGNKIIYTYGSGESFGEMSILTGSLHSYKARSKGDTSVQVVSAKFISNYIKKEDPLLQLTVTSILHRLRTMNEINK